MSYDTARPYLAAFVLLRRHGKIAFVLRSNTGWMDGYYGLPAGKVEVNERAMAAAVREAREEVGVDIKETDLGIAHVCHRRSDDDTLMWIDVLFEASTWDGEPTNAEPEVHGELAWFDPDNPPENTVPAVRFYLQQIKSGNTYSEYGWPNS